MDRLQVKFDSFWLSKRSIIGPIRLFLWRCRNRLRFEADSDFGTDFDSGTDFNSGTDSEADSLAEIDSDENFIFPITKSSIISL